MLHSETGMILTITSDAKVELVGSWDGWKGAVMVKTEAKADRPHVHALVSFVATITLRRGSKYEYKYRVNVSQRLCAVPASASAVTASATNHTLRTESVQGVWCTEAAVKTFSDGAGSSNHVIRIEEGEWHCPLRHTLQKLRGLGHFTAAC
jgi:hypothetical protein